MFSKYITDLLEKLHFIKVVIARFFIILFRRRKRIEEIHLNYATKHLFDNSFIIINYRFRNALWYRFGEHHTLEKQIKIFNRKNFENEFDLIVYGFFQKKVHKLKFEPQLRLNSSCLKTSFSNLTLKLEKQLIPKLACPAIYLGINKPIIGAPKVEIKQATIKIKTSTYNQNEFI